MEAKSSKRVSYNQVVQLIDRLTEKDRDKLFYRLRRERMKELLKEIRNVQDGDDLTFSEISEEVELVRKRRKSGAHVH